MDNEQNKDKIPKLQYYPGEKSFIEKNYQTSQKENLGKSLVCHQKSVYFGKILKSKVHSNVSELRPWYRVICASSWMTWFDKRKKACFRSCLTFQWSKVDSDILFWCQKLILTFSEIWQIGNRKACGTNTVNF